LRRRRLLEEQALSKRRTHSPEFKARIALAAISGRKTLQEIAAVQAIQPIQVNQW
jgi:putative transposase